MGRIESFLFPPPPGSDAVATMRWVRRTELMTAVVVVALLPVVWDMGVWRWVALATAALSASPWPGARQILRKAARDPSILVSDVDQRRRRGRRAAAVVVPFYALLGVVVGYVVDGWPAAIAIGGLMTTGGAAGAWFFVRRERSQDDSLLAPERAGGDRRSRRGRDD